MTYALALDIGTTSVKAVLFDVAGRPHGACLQEYTLETPRPDVVELDPEHYWSATRDAIRGVLAKSGVPLAAIASVGVTSQAETLIPVDREGRPLRKAIVWLDNRARAEADALAQAFPLDDVYRITGQQEIIPTWPAARTLWLRNHEPDVFRRAHKYLLVEDYILYRLTGRYVTDRALNPSTLYFDILSYDWWPAMLEFLGLRRDQLPELADSGAVAGTVTSEAAEATGLRRGTPVTTAPIDQVAGAIGAGNLAPGAVTETTGAAMALCATVDRPVYDPQKRLGLYCHARRNRYVLLPWVPTAGLALRWFRDEFGGGHDYETLGSEAGRTPAGADGLIVLPHLSGAGSPFFDSRAKGVFWGLTLAHTRGHVVRAIMESVAFMLRGNLELLAGLGVAATELRALGGAARSPLWVQIKADVCRKDIGLMECPEAACLGVAALSFVGNGTFRTLEEAVAAMVRPGGTVRHDPATADAYDAIYGRYAALYDQMKGTFR